MFVQILIQFILVLLFILWQGSVPIYTKNQWLMRSGMAFLVGILVYLGGTWSFFWMPLRFFTAGGFVLAIFIGWKRISIKTTAKAPIFVRDEMIIVSIFITILVGFLVMMIAAFGRPAGQPIDLVFPLKGKNHIVANGGKNEFLNQSHSFAPLRYGLDIVQVDGYGTPGNIYHANNSADFLIYADSIFAPCSGSIAVGFDAVLDTEKANQTRTDRYGNRIALDCNDVRITFAHIMYKSLQVSAGDTVFVGQPLAQVGYSRFGPHLHIHASRPDSTAFGGGIPIPITFGGQYYVRNDYIP